MYTCARVCACMCVEIRILYIHSPLSYGQCILAKTHFGAVAVEIAPHTNYVDGTITETVKTMRHLTLRSPVKVPG